MNINEFHESVKKNSIRSELNAIEMFEMQENGIKRYVHPDVLRSISSRLQCNKQEAELNALRSENSSLNEELKLMRENVNRCQEEQRRLRKDCDQALNLIHDGIPELW